MKIDRRSFLALGIGATAGTALSPLPWKLTDDSSIWTQNWPWTPVPEDGEASVENSVCTLCPGGCGISVKKIKDRIVKIEGRSDHPLSGGNICALGISGPQFLYGPGRVKSPLKRTGKRGEGKWQKISWDEAISEIALKLKKLKEEDRAESLACISGTDLDIVSQLFNRLLMSLGSPNFIKTPSMQDSFRIIGKMMHGKKENFEIGYDLKNAGFILSFGSGLTEGWGSPVYMCGIRADWKDKKTRIIQIDQRLSKSASVADGVFTVNPGTEADLALGLATVIVNEGLYSKKFTGAFSTGFPEFKVMLNKYYSTDTVSKKTGMKRHLIIDLARHFANSPKSVALCGKGKGTAPGSIREFIAVHSLNALVGNINKKGGVHAVEQESHIKWARDISLLESIDGIDRIDDAGTGKFPDAKYLLNRLPEKILSTDDSPVQALLVSRANPLYTMSDTDRVKKAFEKIPFIISFSSFMDETASFSDLILPDHTNLEKLEDVPVTSGLCKPYIGLSKPVTDPLHNTMHTGDALILLAKAIGGKTGRSFKWNSYKDCLEATLANRFNELNAKGFLTDNSVTPLSWGKAFGGTFRKFAFSGKKFPAAEPKGKKSDFPLTLLPKDSMPVSSGYIPSPPFAVKIIPDTELFNNSSVIEINPATAKKYGLKNGDSAILTTAFGSAEVRVSCFDGIMPGLMAAARGLGHTAYNSYLKDKGFNFNRLAGAVDDPASGFDVCGSVKAKLSKA